MKKWTAITYPQDFSREGEALGPETILRLQGIVAAQHLIENIVLAGGIGPDTHEYPRQTKSFATLMKEWLVQEGTFSDANIHCSQNDHVWNCMEVTLEMIRMITEKNLSRRILVVSAGFHVYPRMWSTWKILCPPQKGWELDFIPLWKGKFGFFHELLGTCKYVPLAYWHQRHMPS